MLHIELQRALRGHTVPLPCVLRILHALHGAVTASKISVSESDFPVVLAGTLTCDDVQHLAGLKRAFDVITAGRLQPVDDGTAADTNDAAAMAFTPLLLRHLPSGWVAHGSDPTGGPHQFKAWVCGDSAHGGYQAIARCLQRAWRNAWTAQDQCSVQTGPASEASVAIDAVQANLALANMTFVPSATCTLAAEALMEACGVTHFAKVLQAFPDVFQVLSDTGRVVLHGPPPRGLRLQERTGRAAAMWARGRPRRAWGQRVWRDPVWGGDQRTSRRSMDVSWR